MDFGILITMVAVLLVVGLFLWAIGAMPWINPDIKKVITILVIVFAALYVISRMVPVFRAALS